MKKAKKIVIGFLVIVVVGFVMIMAGKTDSPFGGSMNGYGTDVSYFDDDQKYISILSYTVSMESEDTYSEDVTFQKKQSLLVTKNELSEDVLIVVKDQNGKKKSEINLKKGEKSVHIGEGSYDEGKYKIAITYPKNCKGDLEIKVDE